MAHRVRLAIIVGIRDGEVVHLKRCQECGQVKRVHQDSGLSEFPVNQRKNGVVMSWKPWCKPCFCKRARDYRRANLDHVQATRRRRYRLNMQDSEKAEGRRQRQRDWRQRKRKEDPTYFADQQRMAARLRLERAGVQLGEVRPPNSARAPRLPAEMFTDYLFGYQRCMGNGATREDVANSLGICERRCRAIMAREQAWITLDIVDTAIQNAFHVVELYGRPIHSLDDLYGDLGSPWGGFCAVTYQTESEAA